MITLCPVCKKNKKDLNFCSLLCSELKTNKKWSSYQKKLKEIEIDVYVTKKKIPNTICEIGSNFYLIEYPENVFAKDPRFISTGNKWDKKNYEESVKKAHPCIARLSYIKEHPEIFARLEI